MGATGWLTRSSTTSMSSGPAISRMNGITVSATTEPSRGTSARLYMRRLLGSPDLPCAPGLLDRRAGRPEQEDGRRGSAQHGFRHAAEDEPPQTAAPMRGHDNQVHLPQPRGIHDGRGRGPVPDAGLEVAHAIAGEAVRDALE